MTPRRWIGLASLMLVLVVQVACRADPEPSAPTATPDVSLATPSPTAADARAAVDAARAAYRGMWEAYMRVLAAPDPDSPELKRYAAGPALKTLMDGVRDVRDRGLKGEGRFVVSPDVTEIVPAAQPTRIGIRDCVDTGKSRIVRASPGPPYTDSPGGRRLCLAIVERQTDREWRVTSFGLHEVGSCG